MLMRKATWRIHCTVLKLHKNLIILKNRKSGKKKKQENHLGENKNHSGMQENFKMYIKYPQKRLSNYYKHKMNRK